jgi:hypothetical protein
MAVADYDGDGFLDLAVASRGSSRLDCLQGGPGGFSNVAKSFPAASFPSALAGGDFDADGYTDLLVSGDSAGQLDEFCGGASGLKRSGALLSQAGPRALRPGDCDGDGFLDLVVISEASGLVGFFKQRYFTPHASAIVDREAQSATTLIDPRRPARFALEVSPEAFSSATHLSVVPGPVFDLPRGRLAREGKYLTAVTEPVTLLPESATVSVAAKLTLRLLESAEPESVRIVRRGPDGVGEILEGIEIQVIDFEGGQGVSFSITGFGSYLAAVVRTRP